MTYYFVKFGIHYDYNQYINSTQIDAVIKTALCAYDTIEIIEVSKNEYFEVMSDLPLPIGIFE